jgi:hypothetical protein
MSCTVSLSCNARSEAQRKIATVLQSLPVQRLLDTLQVDVSLMDYIDDLVEYPKLDKLQPDIGVLGLSQGSGQLYYHVVRRPF